MGMKQKNKNKFIMDTDWLFDGILDAEQKQYVLLDYFQKMNKHLERMEVYPMFIELSLHLGNIQTLITQNKILYTDRKLTTKDDELVLSDLKVKDIPILDDEEVIEYQKILKNSQPQLHDYFNYAKSIWSIVYDSIEVIVKKNKSNLDNKSGFFYYKTKEKLYIWMYTTKKVYKSNNQTKTTLQSIYSNEHLDLTIPEIISKFSKTYEKNNESDFPIFEVLCNDIFPLEETLIPIFKRRILSYVNQNVKITRKLLS
jgi:hypothetical protein